ncbi:MAG: hypothetical protein KDA87_21680 [Planctomycetales bacterium]|nr:hypothetical protein [Planctomycetales bacterium]
MMVATLIWGSLGWLPVAIGVVAFLTGLLLWRYSQVRISASVRSLAIGLKLIAILLLVACLLEPMFQGQRPRPGANLFAVVVDNSQSMQVQQQRSDAVRTAVQADSSWKTRLGQDFDLRTYEVDQQLRRVNSFEQLSFDGLASLLETGLDSLRNRMGQRPAAGVLLFSDGNATDVNSQAEVWSQFQAPIYPVVFRESSQPLDLSLRQVGVTQTNFEAAPVTLDAVVAYSGQPDGNVVVQVLDEAGELVEEQLQSVDANRSELDFRFRFRPKATGLGFFQVVAFQESDRTQWQENQQVSEITEKNNVRWVTVDRGGGPYRILYVAGRPNWEFKFLRRALEEDAEISLLGMLRIAKKEPSFSFRDTGGLEDKNRLFQGFDGSDEDTVEAEDQPVLVRFGVESDDELRDGFPQGAEELFAYHAVILDDIEAKFFSPDQQLLLRRFVNQRGGGFMMLGGQESFANGNYDETPLGELLPVYVNMKGAAGDAEPTQWQLTREGWLQPWVRTRSTQASEERAISVMGSFRTMNRIADIKPGASVLVEGWQGREGTSPLLVTQRFGRGRSAALLTGDLWRWGMERPDPEQDDLSQVWRQMVRWLVADVPKRFETSIRTNESARSVELQFIVRDEEFGLLDNVSVPLEITLPDDKVIKLDASATDMAGTYAATFWPEQDGCYRLKASAVGPDGVQIGFEETGWTSQPSVAEYQDLSTDIAYLERLAQSTGGRLVKAEELDEFVRNLPQEKIPVTETWSYPLWHQPWFFLSAIVCLCGEWGLRRWKGLP